MNDAKSRILHEAIPETTPVIPTIDVVVFPNMVVPLLVLDEKIIAGINQVMETDKKILLLAARERGNDYRGPIGIDDLYSVGTIANIIRVMSLPEGGIKILTQGLARVHVEEIITADDVLSVRVKPFPYEEPTEQDAVNEEIEAIVRTISSSIEKLSASGRIFNADFQTILSQIQDPERIADFVLSHLDLSVDISQQLLERTSLIQLLQGIDTHLHSELELTDVQEKIRINARESINQSQREYYLREQLKAIQKELGEEADGDLEELREKIDNLPLSQEARLEATRQFRRLEKTSPDSMESTVIRNHLEWLLGLPWGKLTEDTLDIAKAQKILNDDHYGLHKVKERILDYLSIRKLKQDCHAPILCFVGPPGVGKTSLGQSIARCMGRKFFRLAMGGMQDEAEIRGHRRTYVGALPGRFVQGMRKAGTENPIILIDEIDKIGASGRGDPSSALLEVLDPEQNNTFYDNYLGVPIDLSKVVFITTANDMSTIPGPLRDRMEIIQLSGYTQQEKISIAKQYLVQKAIQDTGLVDKGFELDDETIGEIIRGHTREAGVRELSRQIKKLCSKFARALVETEEHITFSKATLSKYLGIPLAEVDQNIGQNRVGVTNGLAWTPYGGDVLQVEAVLVPGKGRLLLTGQLGDVMKESAQAAVTFAKSHAASFDIDKKMFENFDLHIHLPAGAIPKDGPSAGVTLLSSILSAITGRAINGSYAMTGELNLQGNVLPIGGLKEKILAAKQHGLNNVILPRLNERDLEEVRELYEDMNIILVDNAEEVLEHVLMPAGVAGDS